MAAKKTEIERAEDVRIIARTRVSWPVVDVRLAVPLAHAGDLMARAQELMLEDMVSVEFGPPVQVEEPADVRTRTAA